MSDLLLIGRWERLAPLAARLHAAGHAVMLAAEAALALGPDSKRKFHLTIAEVESVATLTAITAAVRQTGCPWIALDAGELITEVYESGAVAVLPAAAIPELVESAVRSLLARLGGASRGRPGGLSRRRKYRSGDPILWNPEQVLVVEEGILARTALHSDGTEALLGFVVAGGLVVSPREELFAPALFACSQAEVTALTWDEAALGLAGFSERLRDQLNWAEAWSAVRGRPHLDDRLTGVLELLAHQFGRPHPKGVLVDFRVTHSQLAQAVGSTRSTVTRLLARLRRAGWLQVAGNPGEERWIVRGAS